MWRGSGEEVTPSGKKRFMFGAGRGVLVTGRAAESYREESDGAFSKKPVRLAAG